MSDSLLVYYRDNSWWEVPHEINLNRLYSIELLAVTKAIGTKSRYFTIELSEGNVFDKKKNAEDRKAEKYQGLPASHSFTPIAIETMGAIGPRSMAFLKALGCRIATESGEPRSMDCYYSGCLWQYRGGTVFPCGGHDPLLDIMVV